MPSEVIENVSERNFTVKGLRFRQLAPNDTNRETTQDEVVILKPPAFLKKYDEVFSRIPCNNVVEIGIAEGGSIIYFALAFPQLKFVGIDLRNPNPTVQRHIEALGLAERVKLYYRIDQTDEAKISKIIENEFSGDHIGAIIDDASHWYEPSRKTFEFMFGMLKQGGTYCFEDWSWAHEPGRSQTSLWLDRPSPSNLLFEIIMLQPSTGDLVRKITIDRNVAFVERGSHASKKLDLDKLILNRGKKLTLI